MEFHTIHTFQSMKNIIKRYIAKEQPSHTPIGVGNSIHFMLLYYPCGRSIYQLVIGFQKIFLRLFISLIPQHYYNLNFLST